jgi:hypothetical protein
MGIELKDNLGPIIQSYSYDGTSKPSLCSDVNETLGYVFDAVKRNVER